MCKRVMFQKTNMIFLFSLGEKINNPFWDLACLWHLNVLLSNKPTNQFQKQSSANACGLENSKPAPYSLLIYTENPRDMKTTTFEHQSGVEKNTQASARQSKSPVFIQERWMICSGGPEQGFVWYVTVEICSLRFLKIYYFNLK